MIWIAIGAILIIAVIAATIWVRRHPFETFVFFSRRALAKAGLERKTWNNLVYWIGGRGSDTLVLMHGTNDQAGTWAPVVPTLIDRYRLIIPDLAGHGESAPATGPLTIPKIAEDFAALMAELTGGEPLRIVGNSMGGWIAILYALDHPQKVRSLVLESSGGMTWDITGLPLVPQTREQAALAMRLVLGPKADLPPNYVLDAMARRSLRMPMLRLLESADPRHNVDDRLQNLKAPVTMIWGAGDGVLPLGYAEKMKERIPNATLRIIDDCGHVPHRQKPQRFTSLLIEAIGV